jgi:acyl transferase domain-containing protein
MAKLLSMARRNGQSIYIAGEPEEIVKANQIRNALEGFARRHRISIAFATELLGDKILELMELTREVTPMVISTLAKKLEPEVEGQVSISLLRAWKQFERDCRRAHAVMQLEPDLELAIEVWCNQYGWFEFWETNHWEAAKRREFASALHQLEPTRQRLLERVKAYKQRHLNG